MMMLFVGWKTNSYLKHCGKEKEELKIPGYGSKIFNEGFPCEACIIYSSISIIHPLYINSRKSCSLPVFTFK